MSLKDSRSMWHFHTCKTSLSDSISNMDLEFLKLETLLFLNLLNRFYLTILNHYSHLFCTKPLLDKKYHARLWRNCFWGNHSKGKIEEIGRKKKKLISREWWKTNKYDYFKENAWAFFELCRSTWSDITGKGKETRSSLKQESRVGSS